MFLIFIVIEVGNFPVWPHPPPQFFNALIIYYCIWFMATHLFCSYFLLTSQHPFHNIRAWVVTYFLLEKFFHLSFPCVLFSFLLGVLFTFLLSLFKPLHGFYAFFFLRFTLVQKAASFSNLVRLEMTKDVVTAARILSPESHRFSLNECSVGLLFTTAPFPVCVVVDFFSLCFLISRFIPRFWYQTFSTLIKVGALFLHPGFVFVCLFCILNI